MMESIFTQKWFAEEFGLKIGLFCWIKYEGRWRCQFSSDSCRRVLYCDQEAFPARFLSLSVRSGPGEPPLPMEALLDMVAAGTEQSSWLVELDDKGVRCVKLTLSPWLAGDGMARLMGQLVDLTAQRRRDASVQMMEEAYLAVLELSGRSVYRYLVEGRRAIIPAKVARERSIPEVIDDLPAWNVDHGRIAAQSVDDWLGVFDAIDRGERRGGADVVFSIRGGQAQRRGRVEFVTSFDSEGRPYSAIISHSDITANYKQDVGSRLEKDGLLRVACDTYPEILTVNLTQGTYRILQYYTAATIGTPQEGTMDQLIRPRSQTIHPDDTQAFLDNFSLKNLRRRVEEGKDQIRLTYRRRGLETDWHWVETKGFQLDNPYSEDVIFFAVSRSIDEEKAREMLLQDQLRQQAEELSITMGQIGKHISYYDVATRRLDTLPAAAERFGCPQVMEDYPESFLADPPPGYPPETGALLRQMVERIRSGEKSGTFIYPTVDANGEPVWLRRNFINIFDRNGAPVRAVIASEDITDTYRREEENRRLRQEADRLERIFALVAQHSNRILYAYDPATGVTRPWDGEGGGRDLLAHFHDGRHREVDLENDPFLLPDSLENTKRFFQDIRDGVPVGEVRVHVKMRDGSLRWYHLKHSSLMEKGKTAMVLISAEDITEGYAQTASYNLLRKSLEQELDHLAYIAADITDDRIEEYNGRDLRGDDRTHAGGTYTEFLRNFYFGFSARDSADVNDFYSRESLLEQYHQGITHMEKLWYVTDPALGVSWIRIRTELMADLQTGHIKMFSRMLDVTKEEEERLAAKNRADYDAMTGLLRREAGEALIREHMARGAEPGILVVLDLDDLKGINDNFGHDQGDCAISGMARIIQSHFRRDDVLVRAGGDEFMVYLPGAAKGADSVRDALEALLSRIATVTVGDGQRALRCSIGCAVEEKGRDTFASLFKRADTALYHVKRRGKNHVAFYTPDMTL